MAATKLLLNDGTSFVLLNDGVSVVLLNLISAAQTAKPYSIFLENKSHNSFLNPQTHIVRLRV